MSYLRSGGVKFTDLDDQEGIMLTCKALHFEGLVMMKR